LGFYCTESLLPPGHAVAAAVVRDTVKGTICSIAGTYRMRYDHTKQLGTLIYLLVI